MTRTELICLVKKLYYRRKVAADIPELEAKLSAYLAVNNFSSLTIAGYIVKQAEEGLVIIQTPIIDARQLTLIPNY